MEARRPRTLLQRLVTICCALLLSVTLVPALAGPALACSCVGVTDEQALSAADAVFTGTVEDVSAPLSSSIFGRTSADPVTVTVRVDEVYRGSVHERTQLVTAADGGSCGAGLKIDHRYVIFGSFGSDGIVHADEDQLTTTLCSGTRDLTSGPPFDMASAGEGPLPGAASNAEAGFPLLGWLALLGAGALGLLTLVLWLRYARMSRTG